MKVKMVNAIDICALNRLKVSFPVLLRHSVRNSIVGSVARITYLGKL